MSLKIKGSRWGVPDNDARMPNNPTPEEIAVACEKFVGRRVGEPVWIVPGVEETCELGRSY